MALYDSLGRGTAVTPAVALFSPRKGVVSALVAVCAVLVDVGTIVLGNLTSAAGYVWLTGGSVDFARSQQSALVLAALFVVTWTRAMESPAPEGGRPARG